MINKMKRVPIFLMWMLVITMVFFFVDYTWITDALTRAMYCVFVLIGGGILTACNSDVKFWVYKT